MLSVHIIKQNAVSVYLMEVSDFQFNNYTKRLSLDEKERLFNIRHPLKKIEFAASRFLKHHLFGEEPILYDVTGAPYIVGKGNISLSHSHNQVGIAVCDQHAIGFDLEAIRTKSLGVQHKFCSIDERTYFDSTSERDMTLLWSLKETLYKLSDRKGLIFLEDIRIWKKDDQWIGSVKTNDGFIETELYFEEYNGNFITFNQTKATLHAKGAH